MARDAPSQTQVSLRQDHASHLRWSASRSFWMIVLGCLAACTPLAGTSLAVVDDLAVTTQGVPIAIPVLTNDSGAGGGPLAILRVTQPAHGQVRILPEPRDPDPVLQSLLQFAGTQLSNSVVQIGDTNRYPRYTQANGVWHTRVAGWGNWVSGFFPGLLWHLYEQTGDGSYSTWAQQWMAGIAPLQYNTNVDDVGFMINTSFGNGYRLMGNPSWRAVILQTAQSLATRYNAAAGCLSTWGAVTNTPFDVFVDTMMNIEILFRASTLGGDTNFHTFACSHAERTMLNHVRADGSTYHLVRYDGRTGAVLWRGTFAGASDDSTWARGHSWAIYGFTMAYRYTGDIRFLTTAQRLADYYIANVPPDSVPYWDYQAPDIPNEPRDSSAAAIALSGLLELSQLVTNAPDGANYWLAAHRIFSSLSSGDYLAQGSTSSGILLHGTGEPPTRTLLETDVSLIYGDYYFVEALKRYRDISARRKVIYAPDPGFAGTDNFTYQMCDTNGECSSATVAVVVSPAPPALQISLAPSTRRPVVSFTSSPNQVYDLEYSDALSSSEPWNVLATNLLNLGPFISFTDSNPPPIRFYRVSVSSQ